MVNPPFHPGMCLRRLLNEHGITRTRLARHIGVKIAVVNHICNERPGVSATMATRLSRALGTSPQLWLNLQSAYDLGRTNLKRQIKPLVQVA